MKARAPKMGRPPLPKGTAKATMFCVRLSKDERASIERAAEAAGLKTSEWARRGLLGLATS